MVDKSSPQVSVTSEIDILTPAVSVETEVEISSPHIETPTVKSSPFKTRTEEFSLARDITPELPLSIVQSSPVRESPKYISSPTQSPTEVSSVPSPVFSPPQKEISAEKSMVLPFKIESEGVVDMDEDQDNLSILSAYGSETQSQLQSDLSESTIQYSEISDKLSEASPQSPMLRSFKIDLGGPSVSPAVDPSPPSQISLAHDISSFRVSMQSSQKTGSPSYKMSTFSIPRMPQIPKTSTHFDRGSTASPGILQGMIQSQIIVNKVSKYTIDISPASEVSSEISAHEEINDITRDYGLTPEIPSVSSMIPAPGLGSVAYPDLKTEDSPVFSEPVEEDIEISKSHMAQTLSEASSPIFVSQTSSERVSGQTESEAGSPLFEAEKQVEAEISHFEMQHTTENMTKTQTSTMNVSQMAKSKFKMDPEKEKSLKESGSGLGSVVILKAVAVLLIWTGF